MKRKPSAVKKGRRKLAIGAAAPAPYHERLAAEQLAVYERNIHAFIDAYRQRTLVGGPPRQTLFFFPGGMACQLSRSRKTFDPKQPNGDLGGYDRLWLDFSTFWGNAEELGMQQDGQGLFRDRHEYIVVADGAVNLLGCTPHDGLIDWCKSNNVDLFVYNWDWRRRQMEAAEFFAGPFWRLFTSMVDGAGIPEAARNFSLLGHSFGGLIVKLILENGDAKVARNLKFAITAATPFYGYGAQAHRWFEGEELLNGDGHQIKSKLVRVICSLPGLYVLHYLDLDTYQRDRAELEADAYPLKKYPSVDLATQQPFEPWQQQTAPDGRVRYPTKKMYFMPTELSHAHGVYKILAKPNDDPRFFNIRGVRMRSAGAREDTAGSVSCDWVRPDFDPIRDEDKPVSDTSQVAGDNTQPAWTARLVSKTNLSRVRTVKSEKLTHMFLMSERGMLEQLASILHGPGAMANTIIRPRGATSFASDDQLKEFLDWIGDFRKRKRGKPPSDEEIEADMPQNVRRNMPAIAARIIEDILKRPQKT
jgi:hypothetical protein